MVDSKCGLQCTNCSYKESHGCKGCIETNGNPFHGKCPVASCCIEKNISHCGNCPNIPCKLLKDYSFDKEHGDNGERIKKCILWSKEKINI